MESRFFNRLLCLRRFIIALGAVGLALPAFATTRQIQFAQVGLAFAETARLNVFAIDPGAVAPGPCRAQLEFVNGAGVAWGDGSGRPALSAAVLMPGEIAALELSSRGLVGFGQRLPLRAVVTLADDVTVSPGPCDGFSANLEIVDAFSARTQVLLNPAEIHGFNPQPDPPAIVFGAFALAFGQSARVNVTDALNPAIIGAVSPGPCRVNVAFLDARGAQLSDASGSPIGGSLTLMPGSSAFFDFDPRGMIGFGGRLEMRAAITLGADVSPGPCDQLAASVELVDSLTARTSLELEPVSGGDRVLPVVQ